MIECHRQQVFSSGFLKRNRGISVGICRFRWSMLLRPMEVLTAVSLPASAAWLPPSLHEPLLQSNPLPAAVSLRTDISLLLQHLKIAYTHYKQALKWPKTANCNYGEAFGRRSVDHRNLGAWVPG